MAPVAQAAGHKEKKPRGLLPAGINYQQAGGSTNGKRKTLKMMNTIKILAENIRLRKQNTRLAVRTIILESNLRTIAEDPESDKAKQIIARYRLGIDRRKEIEQAEQN